MRKHLALALLVAALSLTACAGTGFPSIALTVPTPLGPAVLDTSAVTCVVTEPLGITAPPAKPATGTVPTK